MKHTQVAVTDKVLTASKTIDGSGLDYLKNTIKYLDNNIKLIPITDDNKKAEQTIRWKRTADQILGDSYVYKEKSCTDFVITFQALCEAKGYPTNFVKVKEKSGKAIHSIAEVKIDDNWYKVDVTGRSGIEKGLLQEDEVFGKWVLWRRGKDSWDVGFSSIELLSQ